MGSMCFISSVAGLFNQALHFSNTQQKGYQKR